MSVPMLGVQAHTLLTSSETWGADGRPSRTYAPAGTLYGSVQPANERDLERTPAGTRTQDVRVILSRSAIPWPVQQDATPAAPPRVQCADGVLCDVLDVAPYDMPGPVLRHWRAVLVRVPEHVSAVSP